METRFGDSLHNPWIEGFDWQEPENQFDRKAFKDVLERGVHLLNITPDEDKPAEPEYVFSLGFYLNLKHPELVVVGLSSVLAASLLNSLFEYVADGNTIGDGQTISYDVEGEPVIFKTRLVPEERYLDYFGYANWFYRSLLFIYPPMEHKFPMLQVAWPDQNGLYPWEDGCVPMVKKVQTFCALPRTAAEQGAEPQIRPR